MNVFVVVSIPYSIPKNTHQWAKRPLRGSKPGARVDRAGFPSYTCLVGEQQEVWEQFLEDGRGFHRTVLGGLKRPEVFTPEIIQNVAAMGIEKYLMAVFTRRGILPRNHTMGDLTEELKTLISVPEELEASLLYFDSLQNICSFDDFRITKPSAGDVYRFVEAINRVALLAEQETRAARNGT